MPKVFRFLGDTRVGNQICIEVFDRTKRSARRTWKLKRLIVDGNIVGRETGSVVDEFERYFKPIIPKDIKT